MALISKLRPARRLPRKQPEDQLIGINVGDTFHNRITHYKCHIVAIVRDIKGTVIVYRYYGGINKCKWRFDVIMLDNFKLGKENGTIV
jgi:hypothetical protein